MIDIDLKFRRPEGWREQYDFEKRMRDWSDRSRRLFEDRLRDAAPMGPFDTRMDPHFPPGGLKLSIHSRTEEGEREIRFSFFSDKDYAHWVIHGTRDHGIDPHGPYRLHYKNKAGMHIFRWHTHHGAKENHFPRRVGIELRSHLRRTWKEEMTRRYPTIRIIEE